MSFFFKQFYLHLIHEKRHLAQHCQPKNNLSKKSSTRNCFLLTTFGGLGKTNYIIERLSLFSPFGFGAYAKGLKKNNFLAAALALNTQEKQPNSSTNISSSKLELDQIKAITNDGLILKTSQSLLETLLKLKTLAGFKQSLLLFSNSKSNHFLADLKAQAAKTNTKKLLDSFNQRIFHESFKNNYILHFKQGITASNANMESRQSHKIHLSTWSPVLYLDANFTKTFSSFQPTTNLSKQQLANARLDSTANHVEIKKNFPKTSDIKNLSCSQLKARTGTNKNKYIKIIDKSRPKITVELNKSNKTYKTGASGVLLKKLFGKAKKRILLACPSLSNFYCANWLLESIKTELALGNNIKRVLNQKILLAQQPVFNTKQLIKQVEKQDKHQNKDYAWLQQLELDQSNFKVAFNWHPENITEATVIPYLIKGLRITFSGRFGGKKGMAKTLTKSLGRVPQSTLTEKIDFAKGVVQTKTGSLGVKIWICYN
uniref:ribosomal protein S3 n=1 Tax=Gayralia brasiliensis TaxID=1286870 RepID=UPI0024114A98|nr:ribosomal protein S3 [Gayralia brasiliensis]YP_010733822.1 ribosomal protein S3 [Monostroma nitidum]WEG93064.1 ribosomal protein S3 [Gayralia brasiliensis]WEG93093.1 ribosomal protein S3 [Monostroma nitidum]